MNGRMEGVKRSMRTDGIYLRKVEESKLIQITVYLKYCQNCNTSAICTAHADVYTFRNCHYLCRLLGEIADYKHCIILMYCSNMHKHMQERTPQCSLATLPAYTKQATEVLFLPYKMRSLLILIQRSGLVPPVENHIKDGYLYQYTHHILHNQNQACIHCFSLSCLFLAFILCIISLSLLMFHTFSLPPSLSFSFSITITF